MAGERGGPVLLGMGIVFALPLAAAWWLVTHPGWVPADHSNHGTLIAPPLATEFRGQWTLVVPEAGSCGGECRKLQSVALIVRRALAPEVRDSTVLADCMQRKKACATLARSLGSGGELVVVDPAGNAMLRYGPEVTPRDLLQDVQRLLKAESYWRNHEAR
jgi:hypothetical protein